MGLARDIDLLRNEKGMTYKHLARLAKMPLSTTHAILTRGRDRAVWEHLDALCAALGADAKVYRAKYPCGECCVELELRARGTIRAAKGQHRYDQILAAVKAGVPDEQIMADWDGLEGDTLTVYHQIADGKLRHMVQVGGIYDRPGATAIERFCTAHCKSDAGSTSLLRDWLEMTDQEWGG